MFLAIVFIALGLFLLLNALGIIVGGNFWGLFWAIVLLAIGVRMLIRRNKCPFCEWGHMKHGHCCNHDHDHTGHDEHEHQ